MVQSGIAELKKLGLLEVQQRLGNPAIYTLTTPKHTDYSDLESKTPSNIESSAPNYIESSAPRCRGSKHLSYIDPRQETNYNKSNNIYITKEEDDKFAFLFEKDSEG